MAEATTTVQGGPTGPPRTRPRRRRRRLDRRGMFWSIAFILPTAIGVGIFYLWPMVQTVYFSFTEWGVFGGATWIGLDNYERLVTEPRALRALVNTVLYTAVTLLGVPIAAFIASLMNRPGLRFRRLYQALFFLPVVSVPTAMAVVWRVLLNGDFGPVNTLLGRVGIDGPYWLSTDVLAVATVGFVGMWLTMGLNMVILTAGIQAIPGELYEAADLDGAGTFRKFLSITFPLLSPSLFFVSVLAVIAGFKIFDIFFLLIPPTLPTAGTSQTLLYLFYTEGFRSNDKGYAAAIGFATMVLIAILTVVQFRLQKRWVHYA